MSIYTKAETYEGLLGYEGRDLRLEKIQQASIALQRKKDMIVLKTLAELLGEDTPIDEIKSRCTWEFRKCGIKTEEVFTLDGEDVLVFYPVDSSVEDCIMTFNVNYRRLK